MIFIIVLAIMDEQDLIGSSVLKIDSDEAKENVKMQSQINWDYQLIRE